MAEFVDISSIEVRPNRQRKTFTLDSIIELGASIGESAYGLLHPIVLERGEGGKFFLLVGERRLRATKQRAELGETIRFRGEPVPLGKIPAIDLAQLDAVDAFEAELVENTHRVDLTIVEKAQATAQLMELRTLQAQRDGRPAPSVADIAREIYDIPKDRSKEPLGSLHTAVRDQLIIAKHASDPDVRNATSVKEAVKIVKKKAEAAENAALAASVGASYSTAWLSLENLDSMAWAKRAESGQFDVILTDPPYGMGADTFGDSGAANPAIGAHGYEDSYERWLELMETFCPQSFRLAAPDAHAYVFCDFDRFSELREMMSEAGWKVFRTPIIWHNPDGFRAPWPEKGPQRKYELVLFAVKGEKRVNAVKGDLLSYKKDAATGHPAQKPVGLLSDLLSRSYRPDSHVWDPFAGSAASAEAAHEYRIKWTGQELDATHYGTGLKRIKQLAAFDAALL